MSTKTFFPRFLRNAVMIAIFWLAFIFLNKTELGHKILTSGWVGLVLLVFIVGYFVVSLSRAKKAVADLKKPDISAEELAFGKKGRSDRKT